MTTVFGYIRVSTNKGQTTDNQKKEITDAGWNISEWFSEEAVSGSVDQMTRPSFKAMMAKLVVGDTIVVSKMDRLGRSARDTLNTLHILKQMSIKVVVLQFGGVDMNSTTGKLLATVLLAVAEMERDLCAERITSGLARTKDEGTILGPPLKIAPATLEVMCKDRLAGLSLDKIAQKHNVLRSSVDRNVRTWSGRMGEYEKEYKGRAVQYKMAEEKRVEKAMRVGVNFVKPT